MLSHNLARRVADLEAKMSTTPSALCEPEYLATIGNDDLEFVAALPIDGELGGPLDDALARMTDAERARLSDILRRAHHGPHA